MSNIKLEQIWNAKAALEKIVSTDGLPAALAYRLGKFSPELERLNNAHLELVKRYQFQPNGQIPIDNDNRQVLVVDPKHQDAFQGEFEELLAEETLILEGSVTLSFDELDLMKLSPRDMYTLDFMLNNQEE